MRCVQVTAEGFLQAVDVALDQCQGAYLVEQQDIASMVAWLDPATVGYGNLVALLGAAFTGVITVYYSSWAWARVRSVIAMR
ncbi:hypothetical protein [Aeromonas sp. FDAARGOS 1415]|uniref:hypothetical protein n=1 Tax=Aeromonas TaxID=642 RepID=UPI001C20FAB7|nr:hypothetical protein [Aeromonas sp. FDAARGOS 1415]QXB54185.1 hypothetical protein I6L45_16645 [Aeromonas sp. FDAARGOS 1415]